MKTIILSSWLLLLGFAVSHAQTADVVAGCIPLEVQFTGPGITEYYWEFGDNASSILQDPEHIFTTAGVYTVKLFEGVGNALIGEIEITVYADPDLDIDATPLIGCSPLQVNFSPIVDIDPDISVLSYLWTFGDGGSSTLENPSHLFQSAGTYTISLAINTSLTECNKTEIFTDLIVVEGVQGAFVTDKITECEIPASFEITNLTDDQPTYEYFWDFGNGQDFMGYDPGSIIYNENGTYIISLTIINEEGCESIITRTVLVGPPSFDLTIPEYCIGENALLLNNTAGSFFTWTFGNGASPNQSTDKSPIVVFSQGGLIPVTLSVTNQANCTKDTNFFVTVQDPTAEFTIDPPNPDCTEPTLLTITAQNGGYQDYEWSINTDNVASFQLLHQWPIRDSLHLHWVDSLQIDLTITTDAGCVAEYTNYFIQRKPDAYFTIQNSKGCAPLTVTFDDTTRSIEEVISYHWIYGNGDEATFTNDDTHSYTYENPGEYYAQLIIENSAGCIDTSAGVWILVGEQIPSTYQIDETEICLGESITISMDNVDPRIDAWKITTDNNRFDHCWTSTTATHSFIHEPGVFDLTITTEYNGCYWNDVESNVITVRGAKANLGYMTNCEDPYSVMFTSKSKGETSVLWEIPENIEYNIDSFTHTFPSRDTVEVFLTAFDDTSQCPESVDSATVYIVDLIASFEIPEVVCDNKEYDLSAVLSQDVHENCHKGYLWITPDSRPIEQVSSVFPSTFSQPGYQEVTLIVEDINGCTDTLTKPTISYGINTDFTQDRDKVCLPAEVNFQDISTADTTLVEWDWSFGGDSQTENFTFTELAGALQLIVDLTVTDEIGCSETFTRTIEIYEVMSSISQDNGPGICIGESIGFSASDFTAEGSFLNFDWNFGVFGTSTNQSEEIVFDQNGIYDVVLNYSEDASGCAGTDTITVTVVTEPIAEFSTPLDDENEICHPAILEFTNNSTTDGPVFYRWNFGGGILSSQENPFNSFPKGEHEVELIVTSIYGCSDTIKRDYILVGPEGDMTLDKNTICTGEDITFQLLNPVDVSEFTWVFGDGTTEQDINPITHTFDFNPPGGETKVDLILKSVENGCEFIITEPISITELTADFEFQDSSYCEGLALFENTSIGAAEIFEWEFGNGATSSEPNPKIIYDNLGTYTVTLRVSDQQMICNDEITKDISIEEVPDFIFFPNVFSPNNDGQNDFFDVVILPGYEDVVEVISFKVYNRWGNLLYDNENPDLGWAGLQNASPAPAEIYAYFIEVAITDCNNKVSKGNVTIVR